MVAIYKAQDVQPACETRRVPTLSWNVTREEALECFTLGLKRAGLQGRYGSDYEKGSFVAMSENDAR